jgi:receptor tyrosine kinase-like orphan receptor 1
MKNVSRYEGEPVRLTCEITGSPVPQYRWFKAAQPLALGQGQGDATVDKRMEVRQTYWGSRSVKLSVIVLASHD